MTIYAGRPVFPALFIDPSGDPQEGVTVTVYNRGTTVPSTLYTDRTKATPAANPFTTDAYGNAFPYLDPGDYDALARGVTIPFSVVADPSEPVTEAAIEDAVTALDLVDTAALTAGLATKAPAVHIYVDDYASGDHANGVVDDTAAILAALVAYLALPAASRGNLEFGPGNWRCADLGAPSIITAARVSIRGAGEDRTNIYFRGDGDWLTFGTFSATPANFYIGTAAGYSVRDLTLWGFDIGSPDVYAGEGSRTRTAIRDNGSGSGDISRVTFKAWKHGVAAPYGSDFTHIEDCTFLYNDAPVYLGPASQQHHVNRCQFSAGVEGLVIENAKQGEVSNCWFVDNNVADITFDYSTSTRFGVSPIQQDQGMDLSVAVNDCWFESGAGFTHANIPPRHVWLKGDNADLSYPRHIKINRPHLVAGGAASSSNSFLDMDRGKAIEVNDLLVTGSNVRYAIDIAPAVAALFAPVIQRNTAQADGYGNLLLWNNEHSGCITEDAPTRRRFGNAAATVVDSTRVSGDAADRLAITADGGIKMGGGATAPDWSLKWLTTQSAEIVGITRHTPPHAAASASQFFRFNASQVVNLIAIRQSNAEGAATVGAIGPDLSMNIPVKYKSGAGATITDADFPLITPSNGLMALCHDSTSGRHYIYVRTAGSWRRTEVT